MEGTTLGRQPGLIAAAVHKTQPSLSRERSSLNALRSGVSAQVAPDYLLNH